MSDLRSLLAVGGVISPEWAENVTAAIQGMIDGSHAPPQPPPAQAWAPPIGIPDPGFGISGPVAVRPPAWPNIAVAGHYYIDNTHAAATDTDNPYGCPNRPRLTIPPRVILQPGSVVEIHGGPYELAARWRFQGGGTWDNFAFIRGPSPDNRPILLSGLDFYLDGGGYIVVENLSLNYGMMLGNQPCHHVVVRGCEFANRPLKGSALGISGTVADGRETHHIVVYNNVFHDNGNWLADFDQDTHGIGVVYYANHVWILDNEFYHNSGNGVQVSAQNKTYEQTTHHVYIGRNRSHHNKQSGLWTKFGHDIVFSENECWAARPVGEKPSSPGDGIGGQYGPENVWIIFNEIHDCDYGIRFSSDTGGGGTGFGQNIYILGNLIYNIHHSERDVTGKYPVAYDPDNAWSPGRAVAIWHSAALKHVIGNSIRDVDGGIVVTRQDNAVDIISNVIQGVSQADYHVWIEQPSSANKSRMRNNLFIGSPRIRWGSPTVYGIFEFETACPLHGYGNQEVGA